MSCKCNHLPWPMMHVPKENSIGRRAYFRSALHRKLSQQLGGQETICITYDAVHFNDFLKAYIQNISAVDYLRTYFITKSGKLDFLYAINDPQNPGQELYFDISNNVVLPVMYGPALIAAQSYVQNKLPIIESVLKPKDGNTIAIKHDRDHIIQLIREIDCQAPLNIRAYLALYTGVDHVNLFGRLHIEYVLTRVVPGTIDEEEFYIEEDCEEFIGRKISDEKDRSKGINNGTLCPPCTNCEEGDPTTLEPHPDC